MAIGATSYPTALDDLSTLIQQHDGAITTLSADMTAGATDLTCADTSTLPVTGVMAIDGEFIGYAAKTPTTLTGLTRGLFQTLGGSAPAPHTATAAIEQLIIAGTHKVQNDAIIAVETKLGIGSDVAALNEFLVGTGVGSSGWRSLTSGDISTALGFTPANIAGAAFSGAISVDDGAGDPATAGSLRLRNLGAVAARNAAGSADVDLVALDASDRLSLRGGAGTLTSAGLLSIGSLATTTTIAAGGAITGVSLAVGTNPAAAGGVRLPNASWVAARNAGNTADINLIRAQAGGSVEVGPASGILIGSGGALTLASDLAVSEGGTGASNAADARTNLGAQALHGNLSALAGLSLIADRLPYANGSGTLALATLTAAGRALLDDANAAAQRTTLGLGTLATQNADSVVIGGGAAITAVLSGSVTLNPPSIAAGASYASEVTVAGAAVGDKAWVSHTTLGASLVIAMTGKVVEADTVQMRVVNHGVSAVDAGSGTLSALVFKHV